MNKQKKRTMRIFDKLFEFYIIFFFYLNKLDNLLLKIKEMLRFICHNLNIMLINTFNRLIKVTIPM